MKITVLTEKEKQVISGSGLLTREKISEKAIADLGDALFESYFLKSASQEILEEIEKFSEVYLFEQHGIRNCKVTASLGSPERDFLVLEIREKKNESN